MARTHGRIQSRIWDRESDFREITRQAQGTFSFLISQADMNQAGLIALRLRRWSQTAKGYRVEDVTADLEELEVGRFILIDWETEEVLVRTFIRNDRVYTQPNVMLAAGKDALEIESPRLRAALLAELDRLPLDELSDEVNGKATRSPRAIVAQVVEDIREAFKNSSPDPLGTPPEGSVKGSDNPPRRHNARVSPSPTPSPSPVLAAAPRTTEPSDPSQETEGQRVNRVARTYTDRITLSSFNAVRGIVQKAVRARRDGKALYTETQIIAGLNRLADEKRAVTADGLRIAIEGPPRKQSRIAAGNEDHWGSGGGFYSDKPGKAS